jgi:hypothetical protein
LVTDGQPDPVDVHRRHQERGRDVRGLRWPRVLTVPRGKKMRKRDGLRERHLQGRRQNV